MLKKVILWFMIVVFFLMLLSKNVSSYDKVLSVEKDKAETTKNNPNNTFFILSLLNINKGCIINSVDGIKKFYHHYFLIKKS